MVSAVYSGHGTLVASSTTAMAWGRVPWVNCKGTNFWKAWSLCVVFPQPERPQLSCLSHTLICREERATLIKTERPQRIPPGALGEGRSRVSKIQWSDVVPSLNQWVLGGFYLFIVFYFLSSPLPSLAALGFQEQNS